MKEQVKEWIDRGRHHFEGAKILFDAGHFTDVIGILIQQALELYLKGLHVHWGLVPKRTHDLEVLLNPIVRKDEEYQDFLDLCIRVSGYYIEERYPPGPPVMHTREEIGASLSEAEKFIAKIDKEVSRV
ncbi:MAG: HEPN domain-containing protein [bacterium]